MASTTRGEKESFRVVLLGIGKDTPSEKEAFCRRIATRYGVSLPLLEKIAENPPVVLKKNLSRKRSEALAHLITSSGGRVSIEKRAETFPVALEFESREAAALALESCAVQRTTWGSWSVVGRVKNISSEALEDLWVLVQLFDEGEGLLTFEEVSLALNPLPPGIGAPFKAVFDGHLLLGRVSVAFKNASGKPIPATDQRKRREWIPVKTIFRRDEEEIQDSDADVPVLELYVRSDGKPEVSEEESLAPDGGELLPGIAETSKGVSAPGPSLVAPPGERGSEESANEDDKTPSEAEARETAFVEGEKGRLEGTVEVSDEEPERRGMPLSIETADEMVEPRQAECLPTIDEKEGAFFTEPGEGEARSEENGVSQGEKAEVSNESTPSDAALRGLGSIQEDPSSSQRTSGNEAKGLVVEEREPFPWIDTFREAVLSYHREDRDGFSTWFRDQEREGRFRDAFHRVLTVLAHARFSQNCSAEKALENTKRVYDVILDKNLGLDGIPPLEGTRFASAETWRDLFFKAIPKLKEIAEGLLSKARWDALEMERLIQIVPQTSLEASRRAVERLSSLVPHGMEIDFEKTAPTIGAPLYRVASRLGVVDPRFDHYRGPQSLGDLKIQSFARTAFPGHPRMVEEPMNWVGGEADSEGRCLPTRPRCEACPFEAFCPRSFLDFDPVEKGLFFSGLKGV